MSDSRVSSTEDHWGVVVPPMKPIVARSLWAEWLSSRTDQPDPSDVRVDTIRSDGGDVVRYRVRGETVVSIDDLAARVREGCEGARPIIDEHRAEWGAGLLPTLLVADLRRHVEKRFEADRAHCACVDALAAGLVEGDASVRNAIAVSFVEDTAWWEPEQRAFVASWPKAVSDEADRQRQLRSSEGE